MRETPDGLDLDYLVSRLDPVDVVLVEGFKFATLRKLEVHRPDLGKPPLWPEDTNILAVASDAPPCAGLPWFDLDDAGAIAAWIACIGPRAPLERRA